MKVTYLGPEGVTFSAVAYEKLSRLFGTPPLSDSGPELALAGTNDEIVPLVIDHGGYGVIAMETKAQGRVDPPVNSFIGLLDSYEEKCPLGIMGAVRIKIHFALMAHQGVSLDSLTHILAHPKALGACCRRISDLGLEVVECSSNGKAAEDVAQDPILTSTAALAPRVAAEKYGLTILSEAFEDEEAVTTFFLLGPQADIDLSSANRNRSLLVFKTVHHPGALVKVLTPFSDEGVNLVHIHSLYIGNGEYAFAIETEGSRDSLRNQERAITKAKTFVTRSLLFGPFPVLED